MADIYVPKFQTTVFLFDGYSAQHRGTHFVHFSSVLREEILNELKIHICVIFKYP
jgi:hypothetical protein